MSDLVQRLRDYASNLGGKPEDYLTWQAADRIEALEAALREAIAVFESWNDDETEMEFLPQLRAALAPEQDK